MLDGSSSLIKLIPGNVIRHKCYLQKFRWKLNEYECILGFICLGYLPIDEIKTELKRMSKGLTNTGYIILVEAIDKNMKE